MSKKYELTDYDVSTNLYRIKALRDFGNVKAGDIGGWVEGEDNLSHLGDCWVFGNAQVYDNAQVSGNAWVYENARVYGNARVSGNAWVSGGAWVSGDASVNSDDDLTEGRIR
jgi:predicted acyltransferase (DUF342 family)